MSDVASLTMKAARLLQAATEESERGLLDIRRDLETLSRDVGEKHHTTAAARNSAIGQMNRMLAELEEDADAMMNGRVFSDVDLPNPTEDARAIIARLHPGDRFRLRRGMYEGPFVIPPGVTVMGDGASSVRFLLPPNATAVDLVSMHASSTLRGVTVVQSSRDAMAVRVKSAEVQADEDVVVDGCAIVSDNCACIAVEPQCCARIVGSSLTTRSPNGSGVVVAEGSALFVDKCTFAVEGAVPAGSVSVAVQANGAVCDLSDCSFDKWNVGVRICGPAPRPSTVAGCRFDAIGSAAVDAAEPHSGLTVSGCRISGSKGAGIIVGASESGARIRDTAVAHCRLSGIVTLSTAIWGTVEISGCRVSDCGQYGVLIQSTEALAEAVFDVSGGVIASALQEANALDGNILGPVKVDNL